MWQAQTQNAQNVSLSKLQSSSIARLLHAFRSYCTSMMIIRGYFCLDEPFLFLLSGLPQLWIEVSTWRINLHATRRTQVSLWKGYRAERFKEATWLELQKPRHHPEAKTSPTDKTKPSLCANPGSRPESSLICFYLAWACISCPACLTFWVVARQSHDLHSIQMTLQSCLGIWTYLQTCQTPLDTTLHDLASAKLWSTK